ncbi:molybdenum ABC transporter ATP-binding protein [Elioraea rosea]|uniref:molybdenum ABC transporter ATP-binding protein n=1 Tax=Elioraea rosea TaxID=2492390 RepID=UPI00118299B8|nr:molybdenum ABC transporter ATP-binding protein [Elioraea rosea]
MTVSVSVTQRLGDFALDVAFEAPSPGVVALFGPSGSGKSSIVRAIAGLSRPEAGRIAVDGTVFLDTEARLALPPEKRRVGLVFQDARLFPHMSVETNLRYGLRRAPAGERRIGFDAVVAMLGIGHLLARRPHTLSGGEKQRVAVGRALLAQPRLLLMDEPLASLDAARKAEVLPFLERLRDEIRLPILYVSHDWAEVARLADTLVLLDQGRVIAAGPVADLAANPSLPLAAREDAGAVLDGTVAEHLDARGLTRLDASGIPLLAARLPHPPGQRLRLRIPAREVSLAAEAPRLLSVHNILAGEVAHITPGHAPGTALVAVRVGGVTLLSQVTQDAVSRLALGPGSPVHALVKSVAVLRV